PVLITGGARSAQFPEMVLTRRLGVASETDMMSKPSSLIEDGGFDPATFARVGKMSREATNSSLLEPFGMCPGQRAMKGSRWPPSYISAFHPRKGPLLPTLVAPLSLVNITSVSF